MNATHEEDPSDIAASLGLDIGSKRGKYRPSDASPTAMVSAVALGEGFGRPRLAGLVYAALGGACAALNAAARQSGRVFIWFTVLTPILLLPGVWLLLVGQPLAAPRGQRTPMWARVGLGACLLAGALAGVVIFLAATVRFG